MDLYIIRDGQQTGPLSEDTVRAMLKQGDLANADMGWRKGLPGWLPLTEVLNPGTQRLNQPPPVSGIQSSIRMRPASSRQKVLLQFLGVNFPDSVNREEAAVLISDALENPKLTARFAKWGDEKLRLHPDLFQEELDYRRANRITKYLELCQTDASDVVKDVTKAHVQVLIESLDKRHKTWEQEPRSALWDYLLPSVSEHFPQLVRDEWKGRLKFGGTSKVAAAYAGATTTGMLQPGTPGPNAIQAAIRGIVFGLVALSLVLGGMYLFRNPGQPDVVRNTEAPAANAATGKPAQPAAASVDPTAPANPPGGTAANPADAPLIAAVPAIPAAPVDVPMTPAPAAAPGPAPAPAPEPTPTPAPAPEVSAPPMNAGPGFTPAPPPPGGATQPVADPAVAPAAPAAPGPVARSTALLTQSVTVQLQFGKVTLNPGTQVRLIAIEGKNVRVNFNNNIVLIPVGATDIDPANTVIAPPPVAPTPVVAPAPQPVVTAPPVTPSAPKPSPSSDL